MAATAGRQAGGAGKAEARAWQRMLSGRRLDLLDPSPLDVELTDIAHGLARVARWNGQTIGDHAYSVAQHSLLVDAIARALDPKLDLKWQLATLLHDAAEYVIGDLISPFKAMIGTDYKAVEHRLAAAIHIRFSLPPALPDPVVKKIKQADRVAAYFESVSLAGFNDAEARQYFGRPRGLHAEAFESLLTPMAVTEAQEAFMGRAAQIDPQIRA